MPQPLVSVIVPVYQGEKTLARCVESILAQSEKRLELILVDDGSTDGSAALCDQFGQEPRCKVIYQPNRGVSAARNAGLALATGQYIQFVDSDDYLAPDFTENLVYAAEQDKADLVISGYQTVRDGVSKTTTPEGLPQVTTAQALAEHFDAYYFAVLLNSPVNKLFRREVVQARFPDGIQMGEDFIFNMDCLCKAKKLALSTATGYLYDKSNQSSATGGGKFYSLEGLLRYGGSARGFLTRHLQPDLAEDLYRRVLFHGLCTQINNVIKTEQNKVVAAEIRKFLENQDIAEMIPKVCLSGFPTPKKLARAALRSGRIDLLIWGMGRMMRGA